MIQTKTRKLQKLETPNCAFYIAVNWKKKETQSRLFPVRQEATISRDIKTGSGAVTKPPQVFVLIIMQMKSIDTEYIAKHRKL